MTAPTPVQAPAQTNGRPPAPSLQGAVISFGPLTVAQVTQLLEQQLAAVWAATLESHGADWREGYALKFDNLRLEKVGPPQSPQNPQSPQAPRE